MGRRLPPSSGLLTCPLILAISVPSGSVHSAGRACTWTGKTGPEPARARAAAAQPLKVASVDISRWVVTVLRCSTS
eukprot:14398813-Alexandrium_andersonii.AAC.1